jgi:hypothetical protein
MMARRFHPLSDVGAQITDACIVYRYQTVGSRRARIVAIRRFLIECLCANLSNRITFSAPIDRGSQPPGSAALFAKRSHFAPSIFSSSNASCDRVPDQYVLL